MYLKIVENLLNNNTVAQMVIGNYPLGVSPRV